MTKRELSAEYNRIYDEANRIFKKYNPCQFKDGMCASNRHNLKKGYDGQINGCCYVCDNIGRNGCRAKALGCKLYTCRMIKDTHKQCAAEIMQLRIATRKIFDEIPCFMTKTVLFNNCINSKKRSRKR